MKIIDPSRLRAILASRYPRLTPGEGEGLVRQALLAAELVPELKRYFELNYERSQAFERKDSAAVKVTIDKQWPVFQRLCALLATIEEDGAVIANDAGGSSV